ncbi:hypothetical protein GCM10009133_36840 [Cocleimonas flava]|jgi:putative addiction module component (TIGR02574 family)|uniref:Putative addiction module component (TIGR02574 family) n=1 Tax=Cocleimonas flava TaxID=634765 RepID=A0A4R1F2S1_9GAMM|nr:addiction module protein [Cocleimonas flava]TCJ88476.1 putative addiction module component (TIGR02574 family) [Cocleimonas flava]
MSNSASSILDKALELSANERADVAEKLLSSLDSPDPRIDELWAKEADSRVEAHKKGELKSVSDEQVFSKYMKK